MKRSKCDTAIRFAAAIAVALSLCGCATPRPSRVRYPALFPELASVSVSSTIAGRYADAGTAFAGRSGSPTPVSLSRLLRDTSRKTAHGTNADFVVVMGPENAAIECKTVLAPQGSDAARDAGSNSASGE